MENKIVKNGKTVEVANVTEQSLMGRGIKIAMGVGLTAVVGYAAYRFVIKPAIAKKKLKANVDSEEHGSSENEIEVEQINEEKSA